MPKYRQIHLKIVDSYDFNEMPNDFARVTWMLLILMVDSEGRGIDNMAWIRSKLYPLRTDVSTDDLERAFQWYASRDMVKRYEANGKRYFQLVNFKTHQSGLDKEAKSTFPAPPELPKDPPPDEQPQEVPSQSGAAPEEVRSEDGATPRQYNADADTVHPSGSDFGVITQGEWLPLANEFEDQTKIPILTGGPDRAYKALDAMFKAGVEPQDIKAAIASMREKNLIIASVSSIINPSIIAMSSRKAPGGKNGNGHSKRPKLDY